MYNACYVAVPVATFAGYVAWKLVERNVARDSVAPAARVVDDGTENDWRGSRGTYLALRRKVVRKILETLRAKHKGHDQERRLPRIAKSLEYRLYHKASSLDEYQNEATLKSRLKAIVREVYASAGRPLTASDSKDKMTPGVSKEEADGDDDDENVANDEPPEYQSLVLRDYMVTSDHKQDGRALEIDTAVVVDIENQMEKKVVYD